MTVERRKSRSAWRRIERWLVGIAMTMIAFVLERLVLRAVRKREAQSEEAKEKKKATPTTLTSKGGKVDL